LRPTREAFAPSICPEEIIFRASSLDLSLPSRASLHLGRRSRGESLTAASLAVFSPSASSRYRVATHLEGYQPSSTCPLGVSHALRAFFHPEPAGLVSCRSRPWGSPFRVDSTRRAVRPLGRRCPPGVCRPSSYRPGYRGLSGLLGCPFRPRLHARRRRLLRPAPLQGFAPCECPCLRTAVLSRFGDRDPRGFRPP
jgi:hypothetical protein